MNPDVKPFVWTGSADQEFVRAEWQAFWRLSCEERERYEIQRYSASGMIVPVLKQGDTT